MVAAAQAHAWDAHGMELSTELARALAHPWPDAAEGKPAGGLKD